MKLRWLRTGSESLRGHVAFIAAHNPVAAQQVRRRVRRAVLRLIAFPNSGRPGQKAGTRELVVSNLPYIVVYRVTETEVQILRVWDTRQDLH